MFVLGDVTAAVADQGPAVVELFRLSGLCRDKGFDCHNRVLFEACGVFFVFAIQYVVGLFVKRTPDSVPGEISYDAKTALLSHFFDMSAKLRNPHSRPDAADGAHHDVSRAVDETLQAVQIAADHERGAVIGPETVEFSRDVDIDKVAVFDDSFFRRDAVGDFVVYLSVFLPMTHLEEYSPD